MSARESRQCAHCRLPLPARPFTEQQADRTLLFPTGFAANLGVLSVVGGPDVTIISDQLNHASIIDGCRLARGAVRIYRHGDVGEVAQLLKGADRAVVVTDTVFSMDGDLAPLAELARLCAARDALLVIDEAHAALGPRRPFCAARDRPRTARSRDARRGRGAQSHGEARRANREHRGGRGGVRGTLAVAGASSGARAAAASTRRA